MSSTTPKYAIPYPQAGDSVAGVAATIQNLAQRADLLLGESGSFTASPAAATTFTQAITLSRTYPGNSGAAVPGTVIVWVETTTGSGTTWNWWVTAASWTGTATTITGFSIAMQWSAAQTNRKFNWRFIPSL